MRWMFRFIRLSLCVSLCCLTASGSSKGDAAPKEGRDPRRTLIYGSIMGVHRLQEVLSDKHSRVCLQMHFSQEAQEVHQDKCFAPSELAAVQFHVTVSDRSASSDGLPILGMLRAQMTSDNLAVLASYEVPIASRNTAVKIDIDLEKPLAEAMALTASRKQEQQQQQMHRSQQKREPSRVTSNEELKSVPSQTGALRPSSQCIADEAPLAGIPAAPSSAVATLSLLQQADPDTSETHHRVSELVAGCLRRVMSTDFKQALLQCQKGGSMSHVSKGVENQSASGSLMPLSLAAYSLLLAIQAVLLYMWRKGSVVSSREPKTIPQAREEPESRTINRPANQQPSIKESKSVTSGASLISSRHVQSSPRAAVGSRQTSGGPMQPSREQGNAPETGKQCSSGEASHVQRQAAAVQWQRAGSRLQRTDDDMPNASSFRQQQHFAARHLSESARHDCSS